MTFKNFAQIVQEMVDKLVGSASALTDINVGSVTRSLLEGVAFALAEVHWLLGELIRRFFVQTSFGQWLRMRAREYGVEPIDQRQTRLYVVVGHTTPAGGAVTIPVGHQFQTLPGAAVQVTYEVLTETVLGAMTASIDVPAISTTFGAATALPEGTPLRQVGTSLAYIDTIETGEVLVAGVDEETDDELRQRVLERIQNPIGPGTQGDYVVWARQNASVGPVSVQPLWDGHGTVRVLILDADNGIPDAGLISDVQDLIDPAPSGSGAGLAPIGAYVTVDAPDPVAIDVNVTITVAPGFDDSTVQDAVQANVEGRIDALGIAEASKLGALADAVWDTPGIGGSSGRDGGNYTALQQRTGVAAFAAADIAIAADAKAVHGTVTVTVA